MSQPQDAVVHPGLASWLDQRNMEDMVDYENRAYDREYKLWFNGRHPDLNDPNVTPWGKQSLQLIIDGDKWLKVAVDKHLKTQGYLINLYSRNPANLRETEYFYRYLVRPLTDLYNDVKKVADISRPEDLWGVNPRIFPVRYWMHIPPKKDWGNVTTWDDPMVRLGRSDEELLEAGIPRLGAPLMPTAEDRENIPLALHPSFNTFMRPVWTMVPWGEWDWEKFVEDMSEHFWDFDSGDDDDDAVAGVPEVKIDPAPAPEPETKVDATPPPQIDEEDDAVVDESEDERKKEIEKRKKARLAAKRAKEKRLAVAKVESAPAKAVAAEVDVRRSPRVKKAPERLDPSTPPKPKPSPLARRSPRVKKTPDRLDPSPPPADKADKPVPEVEKATEELASK